MRPAQVRVRRRGEYGVDGLPVLRVQSVLLAALVVAAVVAAVLGHEVVAVLLGVGAIGGLVCLASYVYTTRRGKFEVWAEVLSDLGLRGDEEVLDAGCGRGAVLLMAAERLTGGRAVGFDLWRSLDQSGDEVDPALRNAHAEGVADRVEVHTGEIAQMPFPDGSFDVVLSSLALHHMHDPRERAAALAEMVRVVRPGGRVVIADISRAHEYAEQLPGLGVRSVGLRDLGWRFWYGGPFLPTRLVTGTRA
ncbi:MAG: class I SAM-dependent methyltransferase [Actinomycetes bacterium]